jgi:hypothetical protein
MVSFIRLKTLKRLLFPQPDGPMKAVILRGEISSEMFVKARKDP